MGSANNKLVDPGVILQVQFPSTLALQCLETNSNVAAVADVESGVHLTVATIAVADVETGLQAIVVVALIFRSRAWRVGVVEVLVADLGEAAVVVLQKLRYSSMALASIPNTISKCERSRTRLQEPFSSRVLDLRNPFLNHDCPQGLVTEHKGKRSLCGRITLRWWRTRT